MKRCVFIDAAEGWGWYDTIDGEFETHSGVQNWLTWADFERDWIEMDPDHEGHELERYRSLWESRPHQEEVIP